MLWRKKNKKASGGGIGAFVAIPFVWQSESELGLGEVSVLSICGFCCFVHNHMLGRLSSIFQKFNFINMDIVFILCSCQHCPIHFIGAMVAFFAYTTSTAMG